MPVVGWQVDLDVHVQLINDHLYSGLKQNFVKSKQLPRQPQVSEEQWGAIRCRRQARRIAHRSRCLRGRTWLHALFGAWRGCVDALAANKASRVFQKLAAARIVEARCGRVIQACGGMLKRLRSRDDASYAKQVMCSARKDGPEALAKAMRAVLKTGRKYRAPKVAAPLRVDGVSVVDKVEQLVLLEEHFALPENGSKTTVAELLEVGSACAVGVGDLDGKDMLTMAELTAGFLKLKPNRAAGMSTIPAEAYSGAASAAAAAHWPVLLKAYQAGRLPLLWRGTRAIALAKPQKDPTSLQGWRNIALFDAASKGICKAVRTRLLDVLKRVTTKGQHGALPGKGMGIPSRIARGFIEWVKAKGSSAALLFLDGQSAYYAVLRQHLIGSEGSHDAGLLSLVQAIHPQPEKQGKLLLSLLGPGLI